MGIERKMRFMRTKAQCHQALQLTSVTALLVLAAILLNVSGWAGDTTNPPGDLPLPGDLFGVEGHTAFVILPAAENHHINRPTKLVWYAPTLSLDWFGPARTRSQ